MKRFYDFETVGKALSLAGGAATLFGNAKSGFDQADALADRARVEAATTRLDADSLDIQVELDQIQLDRELRDLNVNRRKTTSRIRAVLAAGSGDGLSTQLARVVLGEAAGEFETAAERLRQDTTIRKTLLMVRADNLRRIADFTEETGAAAASDIRTGAVLGGIGDAFSLGADAFDAISKKVDHA